MTGNRELVVTAEPGTPFVDTVREVDAPIAEVYRAFVDPDLACQWLGPHGMAMEVHYWDAKNGGGWSYTHVDPDGNRYGFRGVFHGLVENRSLVQTFEYDGYPGHVSLESVELEDLGGRTRIVNHSVFQTLEDRDGMLGSGMEQGVREGYERLETLLGVPAP